MCIRDSLIVCVGWVFFRAKTLAVSGYVIGQMFSTTRGHSLLTAMQWRIVLVVLAVALVEEYYEGLTRLTLAPGWVRTVAFVLALWAIVIFRASDQAIPFVYFQF